MSAPKLSTELRREQIARAALELYVREGAEGFSVAKLSKSVGLVPSAIYRHFHGKEEVLEASMDVLRDKLFGLVEAARDESSDPVRTLELLLSDRHFSLSVGVEGVEVHLSPLPLPWGVEVVQLLLNKNERKRQRPSQKSFRK